MTSICYLVATNECTQMQSDALRLGATRTELRKHVLTQYKKLVDSRSIKDYKLDSSIYLVITTAPECK